MLDLSSHTAVCFTGHRTLPRAKTAALQAALCEKIRAFAKDGVTDFLAGGAVGFDTLASICVLNLQKEFPGIRLFLILPCINHTAVWNKHSLALFDRIKEKASGIHYVTQEPYKAGCMQARNRYLVDHASACIAFLSQEKGGTAFTVSYAKKKGVPVTNLADMLQ